jgi:probable HAF family extracellular repeat protein
VGGSTYAPGQWWGDAAHAFLYDPAVGSALIDLGTLGGSASYAISINDRGIIVGNSSLQSDIESHAFLYDPARAPAMVDLGTLGGTLSGATSINDLGQVVGWSLTAGDPNCTGGPGCSETHTFLYDPSISSRMIDLGAFGGTFSFANAINVSGQIVGAFEAAPGRIHTFVFDPASAPPMIDLGVPLGGTTPAYSQGNGVNGIGQVVGLSIPRGGNDYHGFVSSPARGTPTEVIVDIKPGSATNSINLGANGGVPVVILSTPTFDATGIDPLSISLASASVRLTGKGQPSTSIQDENHDGRPDLVVQVETEALNLAPKAPSADLCGRTYRGEWIHGRDTVSIVP